MMKEGEGGGARRRGGAHHLNESSWEGKEGQRDGGQSDKTSQ